MAKEHKGQEHPMETRKPAAVAAPESTRPRHLPQYKVILHNDDNVDFEQVIETIVMLTPLNKEDAERCTNEADKTGSALVLVIHRERAELYIEQFKSRSITVTIEPTE